jgi:selenocysteine lyase/cysteine desulfurase
MQVDVKDLGCDAFVSCGHKWLCGPKGTGFLYVNRERLDDVIPHWVGGGSDKGWTFDGKLEYADTAHRYDFATQNSSLYEGLGAAIDFMSGIGIENIQRRTKALATRVMSGLKELGAEILTPEEERSRGAVTGFRMKSADMNKIAAHLGEKYKMRIRNVAEAGLNSTRISTHIYNTFEEVELLLKGLKELA